MNFPGARFSVVFLAASFGASAVAAAPVHVRTQALSATGTGDTEKPFSLKLTTAALSAIGTGATEAGSRPIHVRTNTLSATGEAAAPIGGKK